MADRAVRHDTRTGDEGVFASSRISADTRSGRDAGVADDEGVAHRVAGRGGAVALDVADEHVGEAGLKLRRRLLGDVDRRAGLAVGVPRASFQVTVPRSGTVPPAGVAWASYVVPAVASAPAASPAGAPVTARGRTPRAFQSRADASAEPTLASRGRSRPRSRRSRPSGRRP